MNAWINKLGQVREIPKGLHAVCREPGDCIRISLPEGRRSWVGVSIEPGATLEQKPGNFGETGAEDTATVCENAGRKMLSWATAGRVKNSRFSRLTEANCVVYLSRI